MNLLCYGDSNTWGAVPGGGQWTRLAYEKRWTGRLAALLGPGYNVISEGCCGRTTCFDDPVNDGRNGLANITAIIESHRPLDLIIVFLGTNDMKCCFHATAEDSANGLARLVKTVQDYPCGYGEGERVPVLVVSPAPILENVECFWPGMYDCDSAVKSERMGVAFQKVANSLFCGFLDAASVVQASPGDAIHLDEAGHERLAEVIYRAVLKMLSDTAQR